MPTIQIINQEAKTSIKPLNQLQTTILLETNRSKLIYELKKVKANKPTATPNMIIIILPNHKARAIVVTA